MNLTITGHHLEVTPAIRDYVKAKIDRVIRHFDHVTSATVILSVEKLLQKAEVTLHVRGKDIFVEAHDENLYAAVDALTNKLDRQMIKHKQKLADHNHESVRHQVMAD